MSETKYAIASDAQYYTLTGELTSDTQEAGLWDDPYDALVVANAAGHSLFDTTNETDELEFLQALARVSNTFVASEVENPTNVATLQVVYDEATFRNP